MSSKLEQWFNNDFQTSPEIAYWLSRYILCRGTGQFNEIGPLSPYMKILAASQDKIDWRNFMEAAYLTTSTESKNTI